MTLQSGDVFSTGFSVHYVFLQYAHCYFSKHVCSFSELLNFYNQCFYMAPLYDSLLQNMKIFPYLVGGYTAPFNFLILFFSFIYSLSRDGDYSVCLLCFCGVAFLAFVVVRVVGTFCSGKSGKYPWGRNEFTEWPKPELNQRHGCCLTVAALPPISKSVWRSLWAQKEAALGSARFL